MRLHEEMKIQELRTLEHKKKESEAEAKLKEHQIMYEAVRNDRNAFSKSLIESKVDPAIQSIDPSLHAYLRAFIFICN